MLDTAAATAARQFALLHRARAATDALFDLVEPEFLFDRPVSERHRLAFYIGHLEAFDWNLLSVPLRLTSTEPALDTLFAFGIDPVDGQLPHDQPSDWPALPVFFEYRERTRARLDTALQRAGSDVAPQIERLLAVAIEHRQMHAETLSYLLHQLPFECKRAPERRPAARVRTVAPESVVIPAGTTTLGARRASGRFGWDNEFEAHSVDVPAFVIDRYKVTNREYREFIAAGGYSRRDLWRDADWAWRQSRSITHPAFWLQRDGDWHWRAMFDAIPLPLDWPVFVSHAEASAYARWAGRALPTEEQWQRAAFGEHGAVRVDDGAEAPLRFDPLPVGADELLSTGPFPVAGMHGNGWEWTSTVFAPFPGFRRFDFYPGYSEPFFDGNHWVLKGGSMRTAAPMLRPSFRNWFQPHYPYVYAGFRCVDR